MPISLGPACKQEILANQKKKKFKKYPRLKAKWHLAWQNKILPNFQANRWPDYLHRSQLRLPKIQARRRRLRRSELPRECRLRPVNINEKSGRWSLCIINCDMLGSTSVPESQHFVEYESGFFLVSLVRGLSNQLILRGWDECWGLCISL